MRVTWAHAKAWLFEFYIHVSIDHAVCLSRFPAQSLPNSAIAEPLKAVSCEGCTRRASSAFEVRAHWFKHVWTVSCDAIEVSLDALSDRSMCGATARSGAQFEVCTV